jgi:hypothetical protein
VEPANRPSSRRDEVVVSLGQEPQHGAVILEADLSQPAVAQRDDRGGAGVVGVAFVTVLAVQQPHPGGQLGRHVHDRLTGSDQLLSEQRTGPGGALDRPQPRRELTRPGQQALALLAVGGHLQHRPHLFLLIERSRGV